MGVSEVCLWVYLVHEKCHFVCVYTVCAACTVCTVWTV